MLNIYTVFIFIGVFLSSGSILWSIGIRNVFLIKNQKRLSYGVVIKMHGLPVEGLKYLVFGHKRVEGKLFLTAWFKLVPPMNLESSGLFLRIQIVLYAIDISSVRSDRPKPHFIRLVAHY